MHRAARCLCSWTDPVPCDAVQRGAGARADLPRGDARRPLVPVALRSRPDTRRHRPLQVRTVALTRPRTPGRTVKHISTSTRRLASHFVLPERATDQKGKRLASF